MKMIKRLLTLGLGLVLATGLIACQSGGGAKKAFATPDDLKGLKLSAQQGTTGQELAEELSGKDQVSAFEKYADAITELKQKKVDGCVMDGSPAKLIVEANPDLVIMSETVAAEQYAIAVQKGNSELLETIDAVIAELRAEGQIEKWVTAYLEDEEAAAATLTFNEDATGGEIRLGTESGFAPYESRIGDKIAGSDIHLGLAIAQKLNKKLIIEDMAFDGLLAALQNGTIDFVAAGMTVNEERKQSVDFSVPYYDEKQVMVIRKEDLKAE